MAMTGGMDLTAFEQATDDFWAARQAHAFPLHWEPQLTQDGAYRINLALTDRHAERGEAQAGWKVGLTARAIREQFGLPEPLFAVLFEKGRWPSGGTWQRETMVGPGWENELCLTMGATLTGPGVTEADAKAAIASVAPAMEIIETRGPNSMEGFKCMIADNGQQHAFVVGDETPYDPALHDLGKTTVEVFIDGESQERAQGNAVMESSAVASSVWLANKLAQFDRALEAGQVVMTGSFTRQYAIDRPMTAEARFDPFGSAVATFV
jgi:2-keto-4-pentenoate hydratase